MQDGRPLAVGQSSALMRGFTEGLYLALLYLMVDIVGFHYLVSAVLVQVVTAVVGYMIAVKWIWRRRKYRAKVVIREKMVA